MAKQWIKIDHIIPLDNPCGEVKSVNTRASSCIEMIADLWLTFPDEINMTESILMGELLEMQIAFFMMALPRIQ